MNTTGMTFDPCTNSITVDALNACGSFVYSSDGTAANTQCGPFTIEVNLSVPPVTAPVIGQSQVVCDGGDPIAFTITTPAVDNGNDLTYQWQSSSDAVAFTDIAGAMMDTYDPPAGITNMTYYRVIIEGSVEGCTGTCSDTSNVVLVELIECYDVGLTKTVDLSSASLGSPVVFTITVENIGSPVTGAIVNDVLPAGLTFVSASPSTGTYDGTNWTIGNMAANEIQTIEITAIADAEGVMTNQAVVSINETETTLINNEDYACVSVPIQVCDNEAINIDLVAPAGLPMYQWYNNGVAIAGATNQTYNATDVGTYTYTVDGAGPTGDCEGELCCPVVIEQISCCDPIQCIPVTIIKLD